MSFFRIFIDGARVFLFSRFRTQFFALDSAYKECGIQEDIGGVLFQTAGSTATIVVSGYADYTAIISANTVTCRK